MKCRVCSLVAVSVVVAGCSRVERDAADAVAPPGRSAPAAVETRSAVRPRVVFLGDSLTAGYGLPKEQGVASLVLTRVDEGGV